MKLTRKGIEDKEKWLAAGIELPAFDYKSVYEKTKQQPVWVHFGAGNIFRALQAPAMQALLDSGEYDRGLIVCEGFDYEIIEKAYTPYDNLSLLMTLGSDGNIKKKVIGSVMESCVLDGSAGKDYGRLKEIFASPSLQMISFTITEKGYSLRDGSGNYSKAVAHDMEAGPEKAESYIGKVAALIYHRFKNGAYPVACISMDNCSRNGDLLKSAILEIAGTWCERGLSDVEFEAYLRDNNKVSFPWTMIDKITPRPDLNILNELKDAGVEDIELTETKMHTCTSGFVNTEETEYLVIEDDFPAGRPPLEKAGFYFTDRETVMKAESMKVTTCLNPVHTSLAIFGCLLGFKKISDEMKDPDLKKLAESIGYKEGLPVADDPGIIKPSDFIDTVIKKRLPNPFLPDTPQRIATDTSKKLPIRFGITISRYIERGLDTDNLRMIPLVFAGWLRYLTGYDDEGNPMEKSPDPGIEIAEPYMAKNPYGSGIKDRDAILELLSKKEIFGADLNKAGLSEKVLGYFEEMNSTPGSVRAVLKKYVNESV